MSARPQPMEYWGPINRTQYAFHFGRSLRKNTRHAAFYTFYAHFFNEVTLPDPAAHISFFEKNSTSFPCLFGTIHGAVGLTNYRLRIQFREIQKAYSNTGAHT